MTKITHNWAEHIAFGATTVHVPESIEAVVDIVRRSSALRTVGSRHSFNDIADTAGDLVTLRALPRRTEIDPASRSVTVDGGITYAELSPVLDAAGWALSNLASVPDFTVVGAVSTATHGSGDRNRNLAAAVSALELVTASGDMLRLRRGDPDFDGAVVGLGALGVVTALTLDIVPRFDIAQHVYYGLPFEGVVENFDAVMGSAYSVSLFTHWQDDVVDQAWLKCRVDEQQPGDDFFGGHRAPGEASPVMGKDPTGTTAQRGVPGTWYDRLPHARIGAIPPIGGEYQAEYFVARSDAPAAMRALKAVQAALHPALIVAEIRTIAADSFWLSTNSGADSVGFHFSFERNWETVQPALGAIEAALAPFAPRPHWGKLFTLAPATVQAGHPKLADFRALARRLDPEGKFRNGFLRRMIFTDA